jgi:hypothetical protein
MAHVNARPRRRSQAGEKRWPPVSDRSAFSGECPASGRVLQVFESKYQNALWAGILDGAGGGRRPLHCACKA